MVKPFKIASLNDFLMVFKWYLNGFLNGLFVLLIVTSRTSTSNFRRFILGCIFSKSWISSTIRKRLPRFRKEVFVETLRSVSEQNGLNFKPFFAQQPGGSRRPFLGRRPFLVCLSDTKKKL